MQRIINPKIKKARARIESWERFKIKLYAKKVIKALAKEYKKTGKTIVYLDIYKFKEEKLVKVLDILSKEKQLCYNKEDDIVVVTLILNQPKPQEQITTTQDNKPEQITKTPEQTKSEEPKPEPAKQETTKPVKEEYKPF